MALLLTACAAPQPAASPEAAAAPSPEATPGAPVTSALEAQTPDVLPDAGFEPDSYWLAQAYGGRGQALMMSRGLPGGGAEMKCRYSAYIVYGGEGAYRERCLETGAFSAKTDAAGAFSLYEDTESGRLSMEGGELTLSYPDGSVFAAYPARFYRVGEIDARAAWRAMPYNDEARLPLPSTTTREWLLAIPGVEDMGEGSYRLGGMSFSYRDNYKLEYLTVTKPGTGFSVRGIDVGSSLDDICANFGFDARLGAGLLTFYGTDGFKSSRAQLYCDESGRNCVYLLDDARSHVFIYLDDEGAVEEIAYSRFL